MPHLVIQYSENIEPRIDMKQLCDQLGDTMCASDLFPKGGVRVRAYSAAAYSIADQHQKNTFIDLVLRIGAGRTQDQKREFGQILINQVSETCSDLLKEPHFALSLEIIEIDPDLSWKVNTIHPRLKVNS